MSEKKWMIYGANGYTGELIAREARKRYLKPVLAGRNKKAIPTLAKELDLEFQLFDLASSSDILKHFLNIDLVLNCAGPFTQTSKPIIEACLASKTHYFDITGEIAVFEAIRKQEYQARQRGIMLMPGIGFDVVPTDCLALQLVNELPSANTLTLAIDSQGHTSHGTAITMLEGLKNGGRVREFGNIKPVSIVHKVREIPFPHKTKTCVTIPWGDVSTAYYTTGIPNIEVFSAMPKNQINQLRLLKYVKPLIKLSSFQKAFLKQLANDQKGPEEKERDQTKCTIWGQVKNQRGKTREAVLTTPNGYTLTVQTALAIVEHFLKNPFKKGVHTPAKLMGEHFIETIPGVRLDFDKKQTKTKA